MDAQQLTLGHGLCQCGCGKPTKIAASTYAKYGWRQGQPRRFLAGHNKRGIPWSHPGYEVEDRGYETPCWIWVRSLIGGGKDYGVVYEHNRRVGVAHRVIYERLKGPIPPGLQLDHLCRVHRCVNPDHLEPVTNAENARRGLNCKLSLEAVAVIRSELQCGVEQRELAKRFGVSQTTISRINVGRAWRDTNRSTP